MGKINTVAIIGGGVSGLSAGGVLARSGLTVKLFEANDKLGGCSANTNLGGYTFHDGAMYLAFRGVLDHVFEKLGLDRSVVLPLRKITATQSTTLTDGTTIVIGDGRDVTVHGPNAGARNARLHHELDRMLKKWEPVFRLFADDILLHPLSMPRLAAKGWRHLPKLRGSLASELSQLFSDEAARAAMAGVLLYAGTPPQKSPVQAILGLVAMLSEGFYLPEGGMGRIPEALSRAMTGNGGAIFLNSMVDRIAVKNGRVHGLEIDGQGFVEADAVVSTVSGMLTFSSLLDSADVPEGARRKVQSAPLSHKSIGIQLGLSNRIDVPSHSNSLLPMMDEQHQVFIPDAYEIKWPTFSVPTVTLPELAPPGGSIVEIFPPIAQDMPADAWDDRRTETIVDLAVAALARTHAIDVVVKRVLSPKDFQDRMHLYKGAIYGLSPNAALSAQFPHRSVIRGLYQAGQTTYPGFGVSSAAMSGVLAAEALMRRAHR